MGIHDPLTELREWRNLGRMRDDLILAAYAKGHSKSVIARAAGLTRARVRQIVNKKAK